tara:strand:- start:1395 stop:1673 length:279 start_codon:yes stop_codon:yes gene_type:complete
MEANKIKVIGTEAKFYGYLTAMAVATQDDPAMLAMFVYRNVPTTWEIPDRKLFRLLLHELDVSAGGVVDVGDPLQDKISIKKTRGEWVVRSV